MAKRRKSPLLIFLLTLMPMQCIFLPLNSLASYLTLAWDSSAEPDLAGYSIYYGTASREYVDSIDVGNITTYRLDHLLDGLTYFIAVTAYDTSGNESDFSHEVSVSVSVKDTSFSGVTLNEIGSEDGFTEWGCFIATAAYGSLWEPRVQALRDFRDHYLTKTQLGKSFVRDYYRYSPFIAKHIKANPSLKGATRMSLTPLIFLSQVLVRSTLTDKIVYLLFVLCYSLCIFRWLLKNHPDI